MTGQENNHNNEIESTTPLDSISAEHKNDPEFQKTKVTESPPYLGTNVLSKDAPQINAVYDQNTSITVQEPTRKKSKKKAVIIVAVTLVALISILLLSILVLPNLLKSKEQLLEEKRYTEAYQKASDEEKRDVIGENIAAYTCENLIVYSLKDPESFKLTDIYYNPDYPGDIVLSVSGTNGFGGKSTSYWLCYYSDEDKDFKVFSSVSSLEDDTYSKYDSKSKSLEKLYDNISRDIIKKIVSKESKVDKSAVKRINNLFNEDNLEDIKLIEGLNLKNGKEVTKED